MWPVELFCLYKTIEMVLGLGGWLREWLMEVCNLLLKFRGPQIEHLLENTNNLVESWFLNIILKKSMTLCVMGPKMVFKLRAQRLATKTLTKILSFSNKPPREVKERNECVKVP
jgi:hypothetical protein